VIVRQVGLGREIFRQVDLGREIFIHLLLTDEVLVVAQLVGVVFNMTFNLKRFCYVREYSESTSRTDFGGEYSQSWSRTVWYYGCSYSKTMSGPTNSSGSASREEDAIDYSRSKPAYSKSRSFRRRGF
jgi:hypothetical protein